MGVPQRLLYRVRLLTNLSILVWANIVTTSSKAVRKGLLHLLFGVVPDVRTDTGLLTNTYELMQDRLRHSLREVGQKTRELEESEEQLRDSRDLLQTIIDSLSGVLIVLDRQLVITQANKSARYEHGDKEVIGRHCYEVTHGLNHPCHSPDCICPATKVRQTGEPVRVVHTHSFSQNGVRQDKYVEVSASPLYDSAGKITHVVELIWDITESKEQENRILEANRALLALNDIAITVSQSLSLDLILNTALDKALGLIGGEIGGILLPDQKSQALSYQAHRGLSDEFLRGTADIVIGEGIAGRVMEQGEPVVVDDASKDPQVSRQLVVAEEGLKSFVGVPLKSKKKVVGVLTIARREARSFSQRDVQLLTALGHQLGIAIENAQLYQELQIREQMRAQLLRKIITAHEDERRRLARGLHDITSQALATLAVRVEVLFSVQRSDSENAETQLEEIRSLLASTSKEVHRLIYDLRPSMLDDLGLLVALQSCAHRLLEAIGIEVHIEVVGQEKRLPSEVEIALFRIVQEAITNIASHSRAESTYISLEFKDKGIAVQVEDDGIGFDLPHISVSSHVEDMVGLLGMQERAELLGGTLNIDTEPGKGTRVSVEIPSDLERGDG